MLKNIKLENINIKYNVNLKNIIIKDNELCEILFQFNSNKLDYLKKSYHANIKNGNNYIIYSKNAYEYTVFTHIFIYLVFIQNYII